MMLHSGSSVSILRLDSIPAKSNSRQLPRMPSSLHLIIAGDSSFHIKDYVQPVQIGDAEVIQQFLVAESLIAPARRSTR